MKNKKEENNFLNNFKTDFDILKENFRFIWDEESEVKDLKEKYAKEYYDKLFKEYCVADLSNYKKGKY